MLSPWWSPKWSRSSDYFDIFIQKPSSREWDNAMIIRLHWLSTNRLQTGLKSSKSVSQQSGANRKGVEHTSPKTKKVRSLASNKLFDISQRSYFLLSLKICNIKETLRLQKNGESWKDKSFFLSSTLKLFSIDFLICHTLWKNQIRIRDFSHLLFIIMNVN